MPSSHRVLLLALATKWIGAARLPGAMKRAGFEVGVLAPQGSLIVTTIFGRPTPLELEYWQIEKV